MNKHPFLARLGRKFRVEVPVVDDDYDVNSPLYKVGKAYHEETEPHRKRVLVSLLGRLQMIAKKRQVTVSDMSREASHIIRSASWSIKDDDQYRDIIDMIVPFVTAQDLSDAELREIIKDLDNHEPRYIMRYLKRRYPDNEIDIHSTTNRILGQLGYH